METSAISDAQMVPFPTLDDIWDQFGKNRIDENIYARAKRDYETKLKSETDLFEQFKRRHDASEADIIQMFCTFLVREAVHLAQNNNI